MPQPLGYRIFTTHRGERLAWCGVAGRWWFAPLPSAAVCEFRSVSAALGEVKKLLVSFDRFAMIRKPEDTPDGSGVEYVDPKTVNMYVD